MGQSPINLFKPNLAVSGHQPVNRTALLLGTKHVLFLTRKLARARQTAI